MAAPTSGPETPDRGPVGQSSPESSEAGTPSMEKLRGPVVPGTSAQGTPERTRTGLSTPEKLKGSVKTGDVDTETMLKYLTGITNHSVCLKNPKF